MEGEAEVGLASAVEFWFGMPSLAKILIVVGSKSRGHSDPA